jgi:hypothetical protein
MRERKSAEEVAEILMRKYREAFGGKERGKYRFSRRALLVLSGRGALRDVFVGDLKAALLDENFCLLDLRDTDARSDFALMSVTFINDLRPLTKKEYVQDAA